MTCRALAISRVALLLCLFTLLVVPVHSQEPPPGDGMTDALASESALARIQRDGRVRVGMLYNAPPFGELTIRGDVVGFDADLARSLAELWGVELEIVQVTRQTAHRALLDGTVDMLIAAQVRDRAADARFEFSHTYYRGGQLLLVRADEAAQSPAEFGGRRVGYTMGTRAEQGLAHWRDHGGPTVEAQGFYTLDQAVVALAEGRVDAVLGPRSQLMRASLPGVTQMLEGQVMPEPYAVALRRHDAPMRALVNRSLQVLAQRERMAEIHQAHFPATPYPADTVPTWASLDDAGLAPTDYDVALAYPEQFAAARVLESRTLRVAGAPPPDVSANDAEQRLARANRALAEALAARWGVTLANVGAPGDDPVALVASGQADLAFGVEPSWARAADVDFTSPYLLRGDRLMVVARDNANSFRDLRGGWIGVFATEPGAADRVGALADEVNTRLSIYTIARDSDAAYVLLVEDNADAVYGDVLRLMQHLEAHPEDLALATRCSTCDPWYTRQYLAMAVPRNDVDFRLLVEYTLQELAEDDALAALLAPATLPGEGLTVDVVPGSADVLGFNLDGG